jgi:hypothetical protein
VRHVELNTRSGSSIMEADQRVAESSTRSKDLVVFDILRDSKCTACGKVIGKGDILFLDGEQALCLSCADLDHLEYLPRGDAALTRRAKKYSSLSAVVVGFSRSRGRYERQGILVEVSGLERAEEDSTACRAVQAGRCAPQGIGPRPCGGDDPSHSRVVPELPPERSPSYRGTYRSEREEAVEWDAPRQAERLNRRPSPPPRSGRFVTITHVHTLRSAIDLPRSKFRFWDS